MKRNITAIAFLFMFVLTQAQRPVSEQHRIVVEPLRYLIDSRIYDYVPVTVRDGKVKLWKLADSDDMQEADTCITLNYDNDNLYHNNNDTLRALFSPGETETTVYIEHDSLYFSFPDSTSLHEPFIPMIYRESLTGDSLQHLCGVLHLVFDQGQLNPVSKIGIYVDGEEQKPIAGTFLVDLRKKPLHPICVDSVYTVEIDVPTDPGKELYLPVPENIYRKFTILLFGIDEKILGQYEFSNITIKRGHVTEIPIHSSSRKAPKCIPPSIEELIIDSPEVTYDPSPVSGSIVFNNTDEIIRAQINVFQGTAGHHELYNPLGKIEFYIKYKDELSDAVDLFTGQVKADFDSLELCPGLNIFTAQAIVYSSCLNKRVYVHTKYKQRKKVKLFFKTRTCPYDYKDFYRKDSLCGYVEKWNKAKWGSPICRMEWRWAPDFSKTEREIKDVIHRWTFYDNNHFKGALHWLEKGPACTKHGNYYIALKGKVYYRAVTYYKIPHEKSHREEGEERSFSTDIIRMKLIVKEDFLEDGSVRLTGFFNPELGRENIFHSSYFDGYERGFIIVPATVFHGGEVTLPKNVDQYKHVCPNTTGDQFTYTWTGRDPKQVYHVWTYLRMGNILFLHGGAPQELSSPKNEEGIFGELPNFYKPYLKELVAMSDACEKATSMKEKTNILNQAKAYYQTQVPSGEALARKEYGKDIKFQTEGTLPYEIISVKKVSICMPPESYEPVCEEDIVNNTFAHIVASPNYVTYPEFLFQQFPLQLVARIEIKLKLNDLNAVKSQLLLVPCYVPGTNGPDGKQLGYIDDSFGLGGTAIQIDVSKHQVGDEFTVYANVCGWGTPDMLNSMRSITFTDKPDQLNFAYQLLNATDLRKFLAENITDDSLEQRQKLDIVKAIQKNDPWFHTKKMEFMKSFK